MLGVDGAHELRPVTRGLAEEAGAVVHEERARDLLSRAHALHRVAHLGGRATEIAREERERGGRGERESTR